MNSLYKDPRLAAKYLHRVKMSRASEYANQAEVANDVDEKFFESLIRQVYESLQSVSPQTIPELHIHVWRGELDTLIRLNAETIYADNEGIHVGLGFIYELDAAILVLTAYLTENYIYQVAPIVLEMPGKSASPVLDTTRFTLSPDRLPLLAEMARLDDFVTEALTLYSSHLIPEAEARDGYQKRPFELIMEYLQRMRLATSHTGGDQLALTRAIPKPMVDLTDFCGHFDVDEAMQKYLDADKGPYLLRLHLQLLLDALYFVLAHEVAHIQLGHHHGAAMLVQIREDEAAADSKSLALLRQISGFLPRSLIIIFNFARSKEPEMPADRIDHPLAHNRLLILAKTLLTGPDGDALRADVNAGLALFPSRLEPQYLTFGWPDNAPEDVDIFISSYSDMDYTAHIMAYIDRPPLHKKSEDAFAENAFLLAHLAYKIQFEVRDRIDPEKVYAWGGAGYHPTIRPEDLYTNYHNETVFSRLHVSIPAPPEFCLKWPEAEFAVKRIEIIVRAPDLKGAKEKRNSVRFFYEPIELELSDFLQSLAHQELDHTLRARLLLAARRYQDYGRYDASVKLYQWLYQKDREKLLYGDLVSLAAQLMDFGRFAEAAEIAWWALGPGRVQRPRFHYVLAMDYASREDMPEALEETFLEMALFGMYGEMFDDAREMYGEIVSDMRDPVMASLRTFLAHGRAAERALDREEPELALAEFRAGRDALLAGQRQADRDFVFLCQLLSDVTLEIFRLDESGFKAAAEAAQSVLALRPDFVPALMNLAEVSLLRGDRNDAYGIWLKAHAIAPFHSIVFDKREEFEYGLS